MSGVKKHLTGKGKPVPDSKTGVVTYFDFEKLKYRSPRKENIKGFTFGGLNFKVR